MLQQIQQFRTLGEDFVMQHTDSEYLGQLTEELQAAVLQAIPVEKRLEGLSPEDRVQGLSPEDRVQGLSPEELGGRSERGAGCGGLASSWTRETVTNRGASPEHVGQPSLLACRLTLTPHG